MTPSNTIVIDTFMQSLKDARHRALFYANGQLQSLQSSTKRFDKHYKAFPETLVGVYNSKATRSQIIEDLEEFTKWEGL